MLVLTRKVGERVVIGETVTVEVVEIRGGKVRLGITAPSVVTIFREEVGKLPGSDGDGGSLPDTNLE